jgi:glycosyltransferase involved in cell wall biosynthesis
MARGGKSPTDVTVVRTGPDPQRLRRGPACPELRRGHRFKLPVVAFDLRETRVSASDAAVRVKPNDVHDYAVAIVELMDDEPRRTRLGKLGRARVEQELAWCHQERAYLGVYERLTADATAFQSAGR